MLLKASEYLVNIIDIESSYCPDMKQMAHEPSGLLQTDVPFEIAGGTLK